MISRDSNSMKSKTPSTAGVPAPSADPIPAAPPAALSAPPGVAALWHAVTRRWLTILVLGGGLGLVGAAIGWFVAPGPYTGVATLHLDPHPPRGVYDTNEDFTNFRLNMETEVKSDPILDAALKKPEAAELPTVRAQGADALAWLRSAAVVDDKTPGPEALRLAVNADRPEDAAVLANLWAQAAGEVYNASEEARVKDRVKRLGQNYRDMTELLRRKKNDLQARRDLLGLEDPRLIDSKMQTEQAAQAALQTQHVVVELDLKRLGVKVADLEKSLAAPDKVEAAAVRGGGGDRPRFPPEPGGQGADRPAAGLAEEDGRADGPLAAGGPRGRHRRGAVPQGDRRNPGEAGLRAAGPAARLREAAAGEDAWTG